jgi:hypothetical protein
MVDMESQREIGPTTFRVDGQPRPFLSLHTIADGDLRLIDDVDVTRMQIAHGLYCGLQNSVIRRTVFRERRFWPEYLVVEDVLFLIRFLAEGGRIAYFDDVHVIYRVHADNSSASASGHTPSRQVRIFSEKVLGLERVAREAPLRQSDRRKLRQRLAHERFWGLGYAGYWQGGHPQEARTCYRAALREWPWSPAMWKTYLGSLIRSAPRPADGD